MCAAIVSSAGLDVMQAGSVLVEAVELSGIFFFLLVDADVCIQLMDFSVMCRLCKNVTYEAVWRFSFSDYSFLTSLYGR